MTLCRQSLNPELSEHLVDEMLIQHLLTGRLMRNLFQNQHRNSSHRQESSRLLNYQKLDPYTSELAHPTEIGPADPMLYLQSGLRTLADVSALIPSGDYFRIADDPTG